MRKILLTLAASFVVCTSVSGQNKLPNGASRFFKELGGLNFSHNGPDIFQQVAGTKIDKVEAGGGASDWTKVGGRVFVRAAWMVEIGEMASGYGAFELDRSLAAAMQKKLLAEGFWLTPAKFDLNYVRYQKGSTVGTVEVRSYFQTSGNFPLHYEFIFNESYIPAKKLRSLRLQYPAR